MTNKNLNQFYKIIKSVKKLSFDDLVYNLKEALSKAHKQADKDYLIWCLTCLNEKKMNGEVTKEDVDFIESQVEQTLGASVETLAKKPFMSAIVDAYGRGKKKTLNKFNMDYSLGDKDLGALQALQDFNCWWVRGKIVEQTNDIIQNLAKETLESGATRLQFADKLEKALLNDVKETKQYFDLLADHVLTKTQNMGHVAGYEEAGVEYVRIVAVIDQKTSQICRTMNGRIFEVKGFRKQYDKIVSSAKKHDIEGVKAAQPMLNYETSKKISNMTSTKEFKALGFQMPPYHFHCRTTHVAYFENPEAKNMLAEYGDSVKNDKKRIKSIEVLTKQEKMAFIEDTRILAKKGKLLYNPKDEKDDVKHWEEFGAKTESQYKSKLYDVIKKADRIFINDFYGEWQFAFEDSKAGQVVVLTPDGIRSVGSKNSKRPKAYRGMAGDNGRKIFDNSKGEIDE